MRGVAFSARHKRKALIMWLEEKADIMRVCSKFKCTERSLWRWKSLYDGTLQSLENRSSRPHTPHPMSHTPEEKEHILKMLKKKDRLSYNEIWGILRTKYAYKRS